MAKPVVAISGGSKGLGESIAKTFANKDYQVVIFSRSEEGLKKVSQEINKNGGSCSYFVCDVTNEPQVTKVFSEIKNQFGSLDVLINNAGIADQSAFEEMSLEKWQRIMNVNIDGVFLCTREAIKIMKPQKSGNIINVSSLAGMVNMQKFPEFVAYSTSKSALVGMTEALAQEYKPYGIRVNCLAPGAMKTDMLKQVAPDFDGGAYPEQMASLIYNLTTKGSELLTGTVIPIHCNDV